MRRVLIVGATSAIAQAVARQYALQRAHLALVARDEQKLAAVAADLSVRGAARLSSFLWDARQWEKAAEVVRWAQQELGTLEVVLIAHGSLPLQEQLWHAPERSLEEFHVNATSVVALLSHLVPLLERQRQGVVGVISSVAGERGRQQMAVYGAAKAAVTAFTAGVRGYLYRYNVRVITIKPGFVDTPMTAHLRKNLLFASASGVGKRIYRALEHGRPDILYVPWWWRPVMALVRSLPEAVWKRLRI